MPETTFAAPDLTELVETISMTENVRPFLVPQTHTIRQAMEQLERTEEKILFVVDDDFASSAPSPTETFVDGFSPMAI